MTCGHRIVEDSLDRWQEAHWQIHQIEEHFHVPDLFRYSFNAFLRAIKEVPLMLTTELQHHAEIRPLISRLRENNLFALLAEKRDFIVHRGNLSLLSSGSVGVTEGRPFPKMAVKFPVYPAESSDEAYERYKQHCRNDKSFRGAFGPDCDSWPFVERAWKIREFGETDLLDVAIEGWRVTGAVLSEIVIKLGEKELDLSLSCRHESIKVRRKEYPQEDFFSTVDLPN